jgi:hypothetical protein
VDLAAPWHHPPAAQRTTAAWDAMAMQPTAQSRPVEELLQQRPDRAVVGNLPHVHQGIARQVAVLVRRHGSTHDHPHLFQCGHNTHGTYESRGASIRKLRVCEHQIGAHLTQ